MRLFLSMATALLLTAPAAAQEEAVWSEVREAEGIYSTGFGIPNSDDVRIFMSCTKAGDAVEISWHADVEKLAGMEAGPDGMRVRLEGQSVEIRFADGDNMASETVTHAAFQPEEMSGGIFVEFHVPKNAPLLEKFRSSSDAALILPNAEPQTLDLKGADAAIGKLIAACS